MSYKKLTFVLLLYLSSFINSYSIEPDVFVQSTVNRASKVLSENTSKEEKIEKLKTIALETVDIRGIGFYLGSYFMAFLATKLVHDLRSDLFVTLVNLPSKFFDSNTSGHLLSRIKFNVSQVS